MDDVVAATLASAASAEADVSRGCELEQSLSNLLRRSDARDTPSASRADDALAASAAAPHVEEEQPKSAKRTKPRSGKKHRKFVARLHEQRATLYADRSAELDKDLQWYQQLRRSAQVEVVEDATNDDMEVDALVGGELAQSHAAYSPVTMVASGGSGAESVEPFLRKAKAAKLMPPPALLPRLLKVRFFVHKPLALYLG